MRYLLLLCLILCSVLLPAQRNDLEKIIRNNRDSFGAWAAAPQQYEIQVLYTRIDRDREGRPHFTTHRYGVDPNTYFYPASTVKLPVALLALEHLQELGIIGLDSQTPLRIGAARPPQTPMVTDPSAPDLLPTVAHYVRKILLASDNDAYNRLYEFLGQNYINRTLRQKGFGRSRIIHRLSAPGYDTTANRYVNPITFYDVDTIRYQRGERYSAFYDDLGLDKQVQGRAYMDNGGKIVNEPFDFRHKNYLSLQDLHDMVLTLIFPNAVAPEKRFNLSEPDYELVCRGMWDRPRESGLANYADLPDNYGKFWIYGDRDSTFRIPDHVRILNKVGWAYGYLTDAAYIVDTEAGVEFLLTGTIRVNANETFNDGVYEYDEIGLPFFGELGRAVYEFEKERNRRYPADTKRWEGM